MISGPSSNKPFRTVKSPCSPVRYSHLTLQLVKRNLPFGHLKLLSMLFQNKRLSTVSAVHSQRSRIFRSQVLPANRPSLADLPQFYQTPHRSSPNTTHSTPVLPTELSRIRRSSPWGHPKHQITCKCASWIELL